MIDGRPNLDSPPVHAAMNAYYDAVMAALRGPEAATARRALARLGGLDEGQIDMALDLVVSDIVESPAARDPYTGYLDHRGIWHAAPES